MGKKNFAKEPLLYIHQPTNLKPEAPMQYNYVTPKKTSESVQQKNTSNNSIQSGRPIKRNAYYKSIANTEENEVEDSDDENPEDEEPMMTADESDNKKFRDMSIEEKIAYFANTPNYAPKVRCEIKTEERTYRGHITDVEENMVYMRVGKRSTKTQIPLDTINHVKMLGF